ncbi:MAG: Smr/MutS family protein [Bacteroidetes bacterium]|nr:Smr/MutS family protein [Bacteroidota bacterium]
MQKKTVIYPFNFEEKIGFTRIREMIEERCLSQLGEDLAKEMHFSYNFSKLSLYLNQANEFKNVLISGRAFPSQDYLDLTFELNRIKTPGSFIFVENLFDLLISLTTINECLQFFKHKDSEQFPLLVKLGKDVFIPQEIIISANKIIDDKKTIKDTASDQLKEIRHQLNIKKNSINKRIAQIMQKVKKEGLSREDAEVTIRDGHLVIPINAVNKRKLKGYIHDESATGQTIYIEPSEIVDLGNELRELELAEKREIIKILTIFTDSLRPWIEDLENAYQYLGIIDFLRAKALFALEIGAVLPELSNTPFLEWRKAVHPLLFINHKQQKKKVEPLTIELNQRNRILIISGPNAGGKSVCLKTVGLLQYMFQCGLLIPVHESSIAGIFKQLFIDIGDEQSLDNDLSTYSSHLMNLKHLLKNADSQTLFMIDEFGSGTEPQLGGAIAEAILENLNAIKAFGVVTTHYANLKLLAGKQPGMINGAMLFDVNNIQPLYQLQIGKPGSSFAFEIARKIGFPESILSEAILKTGSTQIDFDNQLNQLEQERKALLQKKIELDSADEFISEIMERYQAKLEILESTSKDIIQKAKNQAKDILSNSNKLIENTVREIRETQASKEKTKIAREKVSTLKQELEIIEPAEVVKEIKKNAPVIVQLHEEKHEEKYTGHNKTPIVGDFVKVIGQESIGQVIKLSGKKAEVAFGQMKMRIDLGKLEKAKRSEIRKDKDKSYTSSYSSIMSDLNDKMAQFKLQLDLRGKRADEALDEVRHYIDDAILLRISEVTILHGKGNGTLREVVRQFLTSITEVRSFKDAPIDMGGSGITVVTLR